MDYINVPLQRGFLEIKELYNIISQYNAHIIGGYARMCASQSDSVIPAGDVDVYVPSDEVYNILKEKLILGGFEVKHENEISLSLKYIGDKLEFKLCPPVQLIKPMKEFRVVTQGSVEEILNNFDFTIVRAAIISETEALVDKDFIEDEKHKVLKLRNIHCPVSSMFRCMKYYKKGYWMNPVEAIKLFMDWEQRSPEYRERLYFLIDNAGKYEKDKPETHLSEKDIMELEKLLMVD